MAERPSNVEMIFGDPFRNREHKETARHNRALEDAASERIQKDRDNAKMRSDTQLEMVRIRNEHDKAQLELKRVEAERAEVWREYNSAATTEYRKAQLAQKDQELAIKVAGIESRSQELAHKHRLEEWKYNNPDKVLTTPGKKGTAGYDAVPGNPGGIFGWGKTEPIAASPGTEPTPGTREIIRSPMPPMGQPPIAAPPIQSTPFSPPALPSVPSIALPPASSSTPDAVPAQTIRPSLAIPPSGGQAPTYMVPPPTQTGTAAPVAEPNAWGKIANIMSPPNADAPGGIAQMIFQGIGKGIRAAQERKAAKILAQQQAPVPGVGPQMTAPPPIESPSGPPMESTQWNIPQPGVDGTDTGGEQWFAPAAPVTVAPAAPAAPKQVIRHTKDGKRAIFNADTKEFIGYAD